MSRDQFARVLAWSPDHQWFLSNPGFVWGLYGEPPAPWPVCMTAQRLAWQHGPAEAYLRLFGPERSAA